MLPKQNLGEKNLQYVEHAPVYLYIVNGDFQIGAAIGTFPNLEGTFPDRY